MAEPLAKTFFVVLIFISTFGILLSITPTEFLAPDYDTGFYIQAYPQDSWVGREVGSWDETFLGVSNNTLRQDKHAYLNISDIIEDDIQIIARWEWGLGDKDILFQHHYAIVRILGIGVLWDSDTMKDHLTGEIKISQTLVESYLKQGTYEPQVSRFEMSCDHFSYYVSIAYNSTKFDSLTDAYAGSGGYDPELWIFIGMGYESEWASLPTWMIIAQLLTFQAPDVHPIINGLIAIPLWIAVIYLVYNLLLRMFPFVAGG